MTPFRIDPKTRRLIVSDLTPSVKGEIVTLQEYADAILHALQIIQGNLVDIDDRLKNIEEYTSNLE